METSALGLGRTVSHCHRKSEGVCCEQQIPLISKGTTHGGFTLGYLSLTSTRDTAAYFRLKEVHEGKSDKTPKG
jgi:hypothetical protein